ncbi:MAG: hypothetical protein IPL59_22985 [Candidatus Competibacteraceae bacterium]|nr:hypothetical protein [Candidatus Competibacteraceae bacterium]
MLKLKPPLFLAALGMTLGNPTFADQDAMAKHCQVMPAMPGCERYRSTPQPRRPYPVTRRRRECCPVKGGDRCRLP